jgi:hypothetical protein
MALKENHLGSKKYCSTLAGKLVQLLESRVVGTDARIPRSLRFLKKNADLALNSMEEAHWKRKTFSRDCCM